MTAHFDTLQFTKTLTEAGISQDQAEAHARAHARSIDELVTRDLATKADLSVLKAEIKSDIAALRSEMRNEFTGVRSEVKVQIDGLRSEMKNDLTGLRAELRADMQTMNADLRAELRSIKYGASIGMFAFAVLLLLLRISGKA